MILVCEIRYAHLAHVPFNAGLLATIRAAFPKEEMLFFGAAAHVDELTKVVGQPLANSIEWREILPPTSGTAYLKRFFLELSVIRRLLRTVPQGSTSRLVFTSASPSTVLALKVARLFRHEHPPVQMILHSLSGVVGKRYRRPLRRFQDMKTALTLLGNRNMQYIVLEQSICNTVVKNFPLLSGKIEALDHPISLNEGTSQTVDLAEPIRFGFLGSASRTKGFPVFVKTANQVKVNYGPRAEFHVIGHSQLDKYPVNGTDVLTSKPTGMQMSRADFIWGVSPLHFVVLPHEPAWYTLAASGVLLDAITWQKPVIARKIPIFESMFERYGDIGYLFSDEEDLTVIVEKILQAPDKSRYHAQLLNLGTARKSRAPETLAASYREICKRNGTAS